MFSSLLVNSILAKKPGVYDNCELLKSYKSKCRIFFSFDSYQQRTYIWQL